MLKRKGGDKKENLTKRNGWRISMAKHNCTKCFFRAKYDNNNKSLLGGLWRWHINFCPGWKAYITSLPDEERTSLAEKYNIEKFK